MRAGEAHEFRRMMKKRKRIICIRRTYQMKRLICTIAVIMVFSISAQAKYSGGAGTGGNPYQIANATDLVTLGANTNDYDKCFILTADIALGAFTNSVIAPDTDSSNTSFDGTKFTGFFNGAVA